MDGTNPSGIEPLEYRVIVLPEKVEERTKGGLFMPDELREREQWAETRGRLVAMSPVAFNFEDGAPKPSVGDTVLHQRHAGILAKGVDGVEYRVIADKDVLGVIRHVG